ncbi:MAG: protein BatD [Gammaproteobacteria bacterium]|nr:protein BatD [Gammaproteobacteria bacterium]
MFRFATTLLLCCATTLAMAAELVATVDRNRLAQNETFELTLRLDDRVDAESFGTAQLTGLLRDFEVLGPPQSQQMYQAVNGAVTRQTAWTVTLLPKRTGRLTIPAFTIAGASSAPIPIEVGVAPAGALAQTLRVEVSADPVAVVEQQQVMVTVRLIVPADVGELQGGRLEIPGEEVRPLAEDSHNRVVDGVAQRIAEWRYAIFPNTPGRIEIPAQVFTGTKLSGRRSRFDPFAGGGPRVVARSEPIVIDVQPKPAGIEPWLPAAGVTIAARWSKPVTGIRAGEPVTRTIEITAIGQRAAAIPPLPAPVLELARRYPDQPALEDRPEASGIHGVRREAEAIVPSRPGPMTLPEQRIAWWNTTTGQPEVAVLPAETIVVGASAVAEAPLAPVTPESAASPVAAEPVHADAARYWRWSTGALGVCCIALLVTLLRGRRPAAIEDGAPRANAAAESHAWAEVGQAVHRGDAATIRAAVLHWARCRWPGAAGYALDALAARSGDETLARALRELDRALYGASPSGYDGTALVTALGRLRRAESPRGRAAANELAALYPAPESNQRGGA